MNTEGEGHVLKKQQRLPTHFNAAEAPFKTTSQSSGWAGEAVVFLTYINPKLDTWEEAYIAKPEENHPIP